MGFVSGGEEFRLQSWELFANGIMRLPDKMEKEARRNELHTLERRFIIAVANTIPEKLQISEDRTGIACFDRNKSMKEARN